MVAKAVRDVAVIGVGNTTYGALPDFDANALGAWAFREALDDAALTLADVDGLVVHRITDYQRLTEMLRMNPTFLSVLPGNGRMSAMSIQTAAAAIMAGTADTVAVVYGNDGRSAGARYGGSADRYATDANQVWFPYGMSSPGALNALQFQRHMHTYGTTTRDLAEISVTFRKHAMHNPNAVMRKPITADDHQSSRFICDPLRLLDYCLINDGGVAMILTAADRAKDAKKRPIYLRGFAQASRLGDGSFPEDFGFVCLETVARNVFRMADVTKDDLDGLMIYDNFTPTVLFSLEGFGFCPKGESGRFVRDGNLALGGRYPTNTNGGHLSESYMQGWSLNVEAVRQLRGECGARQVPDCEVVQYVQATPCTRSIIYTRG
jgi:acetyl-CoA acetyltransferase